MKRTTARHSIPVLMLAGAAALPATGALAASSKAQTYKGAVASSRWGQVQAVITVKGKKIVKVTIATTPDTSRSSVIDSQALPVLRAETLQAQSASINEVSGATDLSSAYIQSLQSAIKAAQQHRALK